MYPERFNQKSFKRICKAVALRDKDLRRIMDQYGYPPLWSRPNTFESLVHIILEQQVSLASALAALNKLKEKVGVITPDTVMSLTDEALKACYFSRQKTVYIRELAGALLNGGLSLAALETMSDEMIRRQLTSVKGIGNWTVDIYLIFILHHVDVFPVGDLAAVSAIKKIKGLPGSADKEEIMSVADCWKPYRTIAVMFLWHFYLEERKVTKKKSSGSSPASVQGS